MVTSKSNSGLLPGRVRIQVFSGRPDPEWSVAGPVAADLGRLWASLPPLEVAPPAPPPLGYRGAAVQIGNDWWTAYRGVVIRTNDQGKDVREDAARQFERALLDSAPPGAVPPAVLDLAKKG